MAGKKEYELLFRLRAALGNDFNKSFQGAINTTKKLQGTLQTLNSTQRKVEGYSKQVTAIEKNKFKLEDLNAEHDRLQKELSQTAEPSKALQKELSKTASQIAKTTTQIETQESRLAGLGDELRAAGINTDNLEVANRKLEKSYQAVKKSQEGLAAINAAQQNNKEAISGTRKELAGIVGVAAAVGAAIYMGPVKSSMDFETTMSDVVKVVDGLKDATTGDLTQEYYKMKKEILDLSTKIPMTTKELTEIAAAAGQAGIARKEITKFSTDAAKMGIAFDTTADQAGEWMAKWRTSFNLTQEQVVELSDKINYLGNTSAANAGQISSIVTKIGPLGDIAGFANGEIAALGTTLVSVGVDEDVAATGIKKLMTTMTAGSAATKKQKEVLDRLGMSATDLAGRMQVDAKGAVIDLMKSINKLPEAEKAAALKNYFGEQAIAAIAPLLTNLDYLEDQFLKVGDASLYAGSMESEYAAKADTNANKVELAKNSLKKASIVLGDVFLPYAGQAAEKISELATKFADFAQENPEVIKTVAKIATGLLAFKLATVGAKLGFLELKGGALAVQKVFGLFKMHTAVAGAKSIGLGSKLMKTGSGISKYFSTISSALGGLFSGNIGGALAPMANMFKGSMGTALGSIGTKAGGIFKGIGKLITSGPLGKIGGLIGGQFGKLKTFLGPLTNVFTTAFAPLKGVMGGMFGGLGGVIGKILPFVGVITAIIVAIQLVRNNLDKIRGVVEKVFGKAGLVAFDKFIEIVSKVSVAIKDIFSDGGIQNIKSLIEDTFGNNPALANFLDGFITVFGSVGKVVGEFIGFVGENITPIIQSVFSYIVETVLPVIAQKFAEWGPTIGSIIEGLWVVIEKVGGWIIRIVTFLGPTIGAIISTTMNTIMGVVSGGLKAIKGIVDIFAGIFTGDWARVWDGVKSTFAGTWEAMKSIMKAPLNYMINGVNTLIRGLNKLKIPDWVPIVGGNSINFPEIPGFAKGTNKTPDTFIAGERGAELITNAKNRAVFTAAQTGDIFNNINNARNQAAPKIKNLVTAGAERTRNIVNNVKELSPEVAPKLGSLFTALGEVLRLKNVVPQYQLAFAGAGIAETAEKVEPARVNAVAMGKGMTKIEIHNSPTIYVDGESSGDLEGKLKKNNEELLKEIDEKIRKKDDDERRGRYE